MIKYLENIPAWGLQISALKPLYADRNITLHFIREFTGSDALYKDGNTTTSPMFYILQNGKVEKLYRFLSARYPEKQQLTDDLLLQIKAAQSRQVEQPKEDDEPQADGSTGSPTAVTTNQNDTVHLLQIVLKEIQQLKQPAAIAQTAEPQPDVLRKRKQRQAAYRTDKTFEEEYDWIPTLFNALYFLTSPIVAGFGALFFYNQISSPWVFAGVAIIFLLLELVFRRTIVRRSVAAFMRSRHIFGCITGLIALALSAWSILALWNGTARIQTMQGVFQPSPAAGQLTALTDSIALWRAEQKALEGKWGVSLHMSKDLSNRISEGEQQTAQLRKKANEEHATGTAIWRYFFLLLEAVVLLSLVLPVWYEVRCVQEQH